MKLLVINNLASGIGDGAIYDYLRAFIKDADEVTIRSSDSRTDLRTFLYDAENYDLVVVSGGDGTVTSVAYLLADTSIPVLPFPAGTANLLAMNLLSPNEPHALAAMTRSDNYMNFDLGELILSDQTKIGFSLIAGAGYDAAIMKGAISSKKTLGSMAYLTSAFANATPQYSHIILDIDGEKIESDGVGVLIMNFSKIQFDLSIVHDNQPRDGLFDVVILSTKDAFGLIPAVFSSVLDLVAEYPERSDALEIYRGKAITVDCDPPLPLQYDGEVLNYTTPFTAQILPNAMRLLVSDECMKTFSDESDQQANV